MSVCLLRAEAPHLKGSSPAILLCTPSSPGIFKHVEYGPYFKVLPTSDMFRLIEPRQPPTPTTDIFKFIQYEAQTVGKWAVSFPLKCFFFECNNFDAYACIEKLKKTFVWLCVSKKALGKKLECVVFILYYLTTVSVYPIIVDSF